MSLTSATVTLLCDFGGGAEGDKGDAVEETAGTGLLAVGSDRSGLACASRRALLTNARRPTTAFVGIRTRLEGPTSRDAAIAQWCRRNDDGQTLPDHDSSSDILDHPPLHLAFLSLTNHSRTRPTGRHRNACTLYAHIRTDIP